MELDLEDLNTVKISENDILKEALCVANRVSMNIENNRVHQVDKPSIKAEFSKNAMHYDSVAVVQRRIADRIVTMAISSMMENRQEAISILDAGCGTGYVAARLMQILTKAINDKTINDKTSSAYSSPTNASIELSIDMMNDPADIHLTALDLSPAMLAQAKERSVYHVFQQGDIEALPFSDQAFDITLSSLAIQWCHDPQQAIAELTRVTRSKVMISTLLSGTLRELSEAFKTIDDEQHVLDFLSKAQLAELIKPYQGHLTIYEEVMEFDSLRSLFQSLKNIGATALPARRKGLLGRESYRKLEDYFQKLGRYQLTYVVALIEIS
ncbi:MAG TPA: methyltransferase domain-containing protein [Candidatus Ignatzschineria merdigallinarum]|uniref:Methyltransferase domain-containing protein n=1 Tax=Candidatus Ignatzschineria merdigallinarum TaxID=2838621 RepID=A0A9D1TUD7_9GAMM|nr:methyltransferase domain-containing protein [Candidatus Ignatzschineria merdigallinarum]